MENSSKPWKKDIMIVPRAEYKTWCEHRLEQPANPTDSKHNDTNDSIINPVKRPASVSSLPPELLIEIFGHLSSHQSALYASSLVSRQWLTCAVPILYRRPIVLDTYRWALFILTLTRTKRSFQYGNLITSVDLSSGKSIEVMKDHEFYLRVTGLVHGNNTPHITPPPISNMAHNVAQPANNFRTLGSAREQNSAISFRGLASIIISTSSLIQLAHKCTNLTSLNLSYTSMLTDSVIEETGEYLSTLQYYAIQPGLTHVQISLETAIQAIGKECKHLQELKAQRCEWISAQVIWMWASYCPSLVRIDARRSTKCTVKRLVSGILEIQDSGNPEADRNLGAETIGDRLHGLGEDEEDEEEDEEDHEQTRAMQMNIAMNMGINLSPNMTVHINPILLRRGGNNTFFDQNPVVYLPDAPRPPIPHTFTYFLPNDENIDAPLRRNAHWANLREDGPVARRPPSPNMLQLMQPLQSIGTRSGYRSLYDMIHDIIKDAKDLGAMDLAWFVD
ncbi:hypothetical protein CLU79DRAFT_763094 [Phycomyces nitens]|nr:hypothetical protein CLU79DRAFT_763094 [Phycomyces nitens]